MTTYRCLDSECEFSVKPVHTIHRFVFGHYLKKSKEKLIQIAKQNHILEKPYFENRYTLIELIVNASRITEDSSDAKAVFNLKEEKSRVQDDEVNPRFYDISKRSTTDVL